MERNELIMEIHKCSPMYPVKKLQQMNDDTLANLYKWTCKPAKVVKDDRLYSQSGDVVKVKETYEEKCGELLDPYDPDYLSTSPTKDDPISPYEKRFLHKVSILQNKLRREGVSADWDEYRQCFRVARYISSYPTYRYVRVNLDENDYSFGDEKDDFFWDGKVSAVVAEVKKWVNAKLIKK